MRWVRGIGFGLLLLGSVGMILGYELWRVLVLMFAGLVVMALGRN